MLLTLFMILLLVIVRALMGFQLAVIIGIAIIAGLIYEIYEKFADQN